MIKEKEINILITRRNITYYKVKGYICKEINKEIKIKIDDVNLNSKAKITAICEQCGSENIIMLQKYKINKERGGYYGCRKCSRLKFKETCKEKFGVDNPMKSEEIKNKTFNTNFEKYGVKSTLQSKDCNPLFHSSISNKEKEIVEYVKSIYDGKIITSDRIILNGLELDIYIPEHNLAIEFDGIYWHNEINKPDNNYHIKKTIGCEKQNIQLIHIFEDEWIYKQNIVKSILKNRLNKIENRFYGRKTILKEIDVKLAKDFFNKNHIQGYSSSSIKLGLFHENELVSAMLFTKKVVGGRISFDGYELSRFANKLNTNVIGAASKLLKYFEKTYKPKEIRSYADKRWFTGKIYDILNFKNTHTNPPSYWYIINDQRKHKSLFTKEKIRKQGFTTDNKTAHEVMLERKIYRIYDCGTISYTKSID